MTQTDRGGDVGGGTASPNGDQASDARGMDARQRRVAAVSAAAGFSLLLVVLFQDPPTSWKLLTAVGLVATGCFGIAGVAARRTLRQWPEVFVAVGGFVAVLGVGINLRTEHATAIWDRSLETERLLSEFNSQLRPTHHRVQQALFETFELPYGGYLPEDAAHVIYEARDAHCQDIRYDITSILNDLERGAIAAEGDLFDEETQKESMYGATLRLYMAYEAYAKAVEDAHGGDPWPPLTRYVAMIRGEAGRMYDMFRQERIEQFERESATERTILHGPGRRVAAEATSP